jgi:hypothetical protein
VLGRLRSDTRPLAGGNIRQGAAIEREAGHSRISFFEISSGQAENETAVAGYPMRDTTFSG